MPSRCHLKISVDREYTPDWEDLIDTLLAVTTGPGLNVWQDEIREIVSSLDEPISVRKDPQEEQRQRIQCEIERLKQQLACLDSSDN